MSNSPASPLQHCLRFMMFRRVDDSRFLFSQLANLTQDHTAEAVISELFQASECSDCVEVSWAVSDVNNRNFRTVPGRLSLMDYRSGDGAHNTAYLHHSPSSFVLQVPKSMFGVKNLIFFSNERGSTVFSFTSCPCRSGQSHRTGLVVRCAAVRSHLQLSLRRGRLRHHHFGLSRQAATSSLPFHSNPLKGNPSCIEPIGSRPRLTREPTLHNPCLRVI